VSVPDGPFGAFQRPVTTGVVPLQEKVTFRPETCGKRPVPPVNAGSQNGLKPFRKACSICAPVNVSMTVRLPNGRTENISPQVISPSCSPAVGGL